MTIVSWLVAITVIGLVLWTRARVRVAVTEWLPEIRKRQWQPSSTSELLAELSPYELAYLMGGTGHTTDTPAEPGDRPARHPVQAAAGRPRVRTRRGRIPAGRPAPDAGRTAGGAPSPLHPPPLTRAPAPSRPPTSSAARTTTHTDQLRPTIAHQHRPVQRHQPDLGG